MQLGEVATDRHIGSIGSTWVWAPLAAAATVASSVAIFVGHANGMKLYSPPQPEGEAAAAAVATHPYRG